MFEEQSIFHLFILKILFPCSLLFLLCMVYSSLRSEDETYIMHYYESYFYKVDTLAQELLHDLSVLSFDNEEYASWMVQSEYLSRQFLSLHEAISNLVEHEEEARIYLRDDITYILTMLEKIEEQFTALYTVKDSFAGKTVKVCLAQLLRQSKKNIKDLLENNHEVNADEDFWHCYYA